MKRSLVLLIVILYSSCSSPDKLLEDLKYEAAFEQSTRRLKSGKIKWKDLNAFERSFAELTEEDRWAVKALRNEGRASAWPEIYDLAVRIADRQDKATPILNRVAEEYSEPVAAFYPVAALLEEAADKSAAYYYARAMEFLERARKGNRLMARQAYADIQKCRFYRPGFRDAPGLEEELFALGTTHILLQPYFSNRRPQLEESLIYTALSEVDDFPFRENWQVYHLSGEGETEHPVHYQMALSCRNIWASGDRCSSSNCTESAEVENGYIDRQVWEDSVWVTVRETQYITVSVSVKTYEQSKAASVELEYHLLDYETAEVLDVRFICQRSSWENVYSEVSGDDRALSSCGVVSGSSCFFPSENDLLLEAAARTSRGLLKGIKESVVLADQRGQ